MSLSAELEYIFALEGNPIAAVWRYDSLDEQGEYPKTYRHEQRDGHVYAVRRSWALDKGLIKVGSDGYVDEISRPKQEVGCVCNLQWLYALRDLPDAMMTEKGRSELARVAVVMGKIDPTRIPNTLIDVEGLQSNLKRKLMRWFGRG
jgi:hypothetical protein